MDRILLAVLLSITLMAIGCGTAVDQEPATASYHEQNDHADSNEQQNANEATTEELPPVTLNNGQRWQANPETTEGIENMTRILEGYNAANGDPKALKAALEEEFGLIFERCTMTGEAHNQLHNYLIPIHHALREFDGNNAQYREALVTHLATYANFFQ